MGAQNGLFRYDYETVLDNVFIKRMNYDDKIKYIRLRHDLESNKILHYELMSFMSFALCA